MNEKSLLMFKPDIMEQNLAFPLIMSLSGTYGLKINNMQVIEMTKDQAKEFYYNAHENRINKLNDRIVNENLSEEVIEAEKAKFDEINERNANFISSGKMIAIEVENNQSNGIEEFINFVRGIVENELRPAYSSNHEKFTFACNGIHGADSIEAFNRDMENIEKYKKENRDLTKIYPKSDMPERKIPAENDYGKVVLLKGFMNSLTEESLKPISEDYGFKSIKTILTYYNVLLNNYVNTPNVSNAILLKNSTDFLLNGINQKDYQLKNEQKLNTFKTVGELLKNSISKLPKLEKALNNIDSKVTNVIETTIGDKRDFYFQMHTNKPFKQQKDMDLEH